MLLFAKVNSFASTFALPVLIVVFPPVLRDESLLPEFAESVIVLPTPASLF